jgi:hypothetical protein
VEAIRKTFRNYRFINNAMAALLGAMIVALAVDFAIDAEWIADLFYLVFAGSLWVFYRGQFAPARPPGLVLTFLAWTLVVSVFVLAILRIAAHLGRLV